MHHKTMTFFRIQGKTPNRRHLKTMTTWSHLRLWPYGTKCSIKDYITKHKEYISTKVRKLILCFNTMTWYIFLFFCNITLEEDKSSCTTLKKPRKRSSKSVTRHKPDPWWSRRDHAWDGESNACSSSWARPAQQTGTPSTRSRSRSPPPSTCAKQQNIDAETKSPILARTLMAMYKQGGTFFTAYRNWV